MVYLFCFQTFKTFLMAQSEAFLLLAQLDSEDSLSRCAKRNQNWNFVTIQNEFEPFTRSWTSPRKNYLVFGYCSRGPSAWRNIFSTTFPRDSRGIFWIAVPWRERGVFLHHQNEQENDTDITPVATIPPTEGWNTSQFVLDSVCTQSNAGRSAKSGQP